MKIAQKIIARLLREGRHSLAYLRSQIFDTEPTEEDVIEAWHHRSPQPDFDACLKEWLTGKPRLFSRDFNAQQSAAEIRREADPVLQGFIHIYQRPCSLDRPQLWHEDPFTHRPWPADIHFTRFNVFHPAQDGLTDIRNLWEIGRFGWALPLARAFAFTQEDKYAHAWGAHVEHFIEKNPPEFGPHWLNAMEVALRAIQWCRALAIFLQAPGSTFVPPRCLLPSLLAHGRFIRSHLEWTPYGRTNHYLADLCGLLALAVFVPQLRESREWLNFARAGLTHEIEVQTDADGFHAEASTAYHHFALELYALAAALDQEHQLGFANRFHQRITKIMEVEAILRGPENLDPQIGDDDSGTLLIADCGLRIAERGTHATDVPIAAARRADPSHALRASGIYILRSAALSCHVACGPNGQQGVGGHAHNDKLSVVIRAHGVPVIVDSGTFCYSANIGLRDRFRGTPMHNTIMVDGREQNPLKDWRKLHDHTHARCLSWQDSDTETIFTGEHLGYQPVHVIHRRTLQLDKRRHRLTVLDELDAQDTHTYDFYLHFAPSLTRRNIRIEPGRVVCPGGVLIFAENSPAIELLETSCAPIYGQQIPNLCLHLQARRDDPWRLTWEFCSTS